MACMLWSLLSLAFLGTTNTVPASFVPVSPVSSGYVGPVVGPADPASQTSQATAVRNPTPNAGECLFEDDSDEAVSLRLLQGQGHVQTDSTRPHSYGPARPRTTVRIDAFPPPLIYLFCSLLI